MRFNYRLLTGLICIIIGVALIVYAEHGLHQHVAQVKTFFEKIKDFFIHIGDMITGKSDHQMPHPNTKAFKIMLVSGVVVTCFGIFLTLYNRIRRK